MRRFIARSGRSSGLRLAAPGCSGERRKVLRVVSAVTSRTRTRVGGHSPNSHRSTRAREQLRLPNPGIVAGRPRRLTGCSSQPQGRTPASTPSAERARPVRHLLRSDDRPGGRCAAAPPRRTPRSRHLGNFREACGRASADLGDAPGQANAGSTLLTCWPPRRSRGAELRASTDAAAFARRAAPASVLGEHRQGAVHPRGVVRSCEGFGAAAGKYCSSAFRVSRKLLSRACGSRRAAAGTRRRARCTIGPRLDAVRDLRPRGGCGGRCAPGTRRACAAIAAVGLRAGRRGGGAARGSATPPAG